jgi:tRNA pseudouridine55 synthase
MSSAQVIRDCQAQFNPSNLFRGSLIKDKYSARKPNQRGGKKFGKRDNLVGRVKMGHGGTLDPLATGVLILGLGRGTKSLNEFLLCKKTYETIVLFGVSTDTQDRLGRIIQRKQYDEITRPRVEKALESFKGRYQQMPPLYSALKMEGKPLYEYAREGKAIPREIPTREVEVSEIELVEWLEPGTHGHRWPTEEVNETEKSLATSVWKLEERQAGGESPMRKLTSEQEEEESQARATYETSKRKAEERVDELVYDHTGFPAKRRRMDVSGEVPMMSGALGDLPSSPKPGKGSNLVPPPPPPGTPPPWAGKGPPAARIRMTVTSGFYVRTFCHELGAKLGSAAVMAELARVRQSEFEVGGPNCLEYGDLEKGEAVWGPKVQSMLAKWGETHSYADRGGDKHQQPHSHGARRPHRNSSSPEEVVPPSSAPTQKRSSSPAERPDKRARTSPSESVLPTPENSNSSSVLATDEGEQWHGIVDAPGSAPAPAPAAASTTMAEPAVPDQ